MSEPHATLHLVTGSPQELLEEAASHLLDPSLASTNCILAVRQGGVRDDILALAAERGVSGWFGDPVCIFTELPKYLGRTARAPCDDFERAAILAGILRGLSGEIFGRKLRRPEDFLGSLDRLLGELASEGVSPESFARALESRKGRDTFEKSRDHELALIYREYRRALDTRNRRDGRDAWIDCADALSADSAALARRLGGRREIRLFGLNDLRGGWRRLLSAIAASGAVDRIVVYSAEALDLDFDERRPAPPRGGAVPVAGRECVAAPDVDREVEEVASRIRTLADRGVPLRRIAVVARQARPYVELASAALERCGVPVTARRRIGLQEIPVVRAVRALFSAAGDGWSRHALVEVAEQPYFASELDPGILNFAGFRRRIAGLSQWERALRDLHAEAARDEARPADDHGERHNPLPPASRVAAALEGWHRFAERAGALDGTRTLRDWVGWLEAFLASDPWRMADRINAVPEGRFDIVRLDLAGWEALAEITAGWSAALDTWGNAEDRLSIHDFAAQLTELLQGDIALWTPMRRGVQVLEAHAAAYRSFDHLFLIGLEAGRFPLRAPVSPILDEGDRRELAALGVPFETRDAWDAREQELFGVIAASAVQRFTASWSRLDTAGREVVRSAFVDDLLESSGLEPLEIPTSRVLTDGVRRYRGHDAARQASRAVGIERIRAAGGLSAYNGLIEDPTLLTWLAQAFGDDRLWSPTQLESFAKCPWAYLSARLLRLVRLDDPDEEMDPMTRGSILHDALRRFYTEEGVRTGGPVFLRGADLTRALPLMEDALDAALADARGKVWLGHPSLQEAKRAELRRLLSRYLAFETEHNDKMYNNRTNNAYILRTGVVEHELAFDGLVLDRGGVRFRFRGSIDRVESGVDERVPAGQFLAAVDYKTSASSAPGGGCRDRELPWADGVVLQVPLYAHALSQLRPDAVVARVEYRAIRQRKTVHSLELYQVDRKTHEIIADESAAARLDAALDAVAGHVQRARRGEFPAAPAESCGCPDFCPSIEICRVPGGPRKATR